jgi:predicted alpha-1,2-mannosidase
VSVANARANLDAEIPNSKGFDQVAADALAGWNADLGKIQVSGGTQDQRRIFYSALYHALLHPRVNSDVNGQYQGMGGSGVRTASGYTHYDLFSLWDTYRSLHPLLSLLYPARQQDMVRSMVAMYRESGWLPQWEFAGREAKIMVGDPAAVVIADTYLKGIRGFDVATAYAAMRKSAVTTSGNRLRPCLNCYVTHKYLPQDVCTKRGSVSITQEYAYADYAVSRLAQALGKTADYQTFSARSLYYRNLFDAPSGFLRPRNSDGSWMAPFDPLCCSLGTGKYQGPGYVEGTAWQYLFMVPFDVDGLKALLGGDLAFVTKLNQAFTSGGAYYSLINEPDILYPYLYTYVPGQAWRTQARVRQDIAANFTAARSGLPGNDDAGQTSSLLVFVPPAVGGTPTWSLRGQGHG